MSGRRVALAYSGGLDSYLGYRRARYEGLDLVMYHVDLGHPQAANEWATIEAQGLDGMTMAINLSLMHLGAYRGMDTHIVPGRNLTLAVIGAHLAPEVWICAVEGERHPYGNRDKSVEFYHATSAALTYSWQPLRPETTLVAPFGMFTKAQAIASARHSYGVTADDLALTHSCYNDPPPSRCGKCIACFHRWLALYANGITEAHSEPPWWSARGDAELAACQAADDAQDFTHYHPQRINETLLHTYARRGIDVARGQEPDHVRDRQDV